MYKLEGMIAAVPTPFFPDESVDFEGFRLLVEHLISGGLHGVLVGGSTGEYTLLSREERKNLIKVACETSAGRVPIIAGTGCARPADTIELCNFAAEVGADATLVITPHYMIMTKESLIDYYKEVASNSKIGIIIYHYAGATGVMLDPDLVVELSKIDNIIGIKNTEDMDHTAKIIGLTHENEKFNVVVGYDSLAVSTLATGGTGSMGVIHNVVPKEMVKIYDYIKNNNLTEATKLNRKLLPLVLLLEEEPYPGPVKVALELMGLPGGIPRKPIAAPTSELREKMKKCLIDLGVLK